MDVILRRGRLSKQPKLCQDAQGLLKTSRAVPNASQTLPRRSQSTPQWSQNTSTTTQNASNTIGKILRATSEHPLENINSEPESFMVCAAKQFCLPRWLPKPLPKHPKQFQTHKAKKICMKTPWRNKKKHLLYLYTGSVTSLLPKLFEIVSDGLESFLVGFEWA